MDTNLTILVRERISVVKVVTTEMKTLAVGIKGIALAATLLVGMALISCGPNDRPSDAPGPNLPSGVARPGTAATTAEAPASMPVPVEVTRITSESPIASPTAAATGAAAKSGATTGAAASGGFTLLVMHTNDVRGYSLPCG
jgi:hypothetical protein